MNYEQKYHEALERANEAVKRGMVSQNFVDDIFGVESEDERIRKFLIDILSSGVWRTEWPFSPVDCVAYLEKQKEQKPAEWSEEDEKELDHIINILDELGFKEFCKSSRDQDTEEERLYYEEIQFLKRLKSLRPQPKQEWSEEDERMLTRCIKSIECSKQFADSQTFNEAKDKEINWLKSLRPSWKPSEEQMDAMEEVRTIFHHHHLWDEINPILYYYEELMRDLQKLM